ncbi:uncharacterized protein LOC111687269 [Lucilia cuprina]|uniref:uncharacterized protein LOC111687269 n=1 Tax=Lucilia cuprina TaxID=7375 RepID=UPI001F058D4D|nr:uncharacterized protein LOC111687269 [Lucilia cuprina]
MSFKSVKNIGTVSQKCGEIIITMKKNAKNVYSYNCWFCDTICIQMKKFTLHLEQEHITQLEQATAIVTDTNNEDNLDDKLEIQKETAIDSIFVGEIKIEDCFNDNSDDLISELGEEKSQIVTRCLKKDQLMQNSQDPLEAFESNATENVLPVSLENDNEAFKIDNSNLKDEFQFENVKTNMLSDDEQLENNSDFSKNHNDSDSDFKMEYSSEENLIKPLKNNRKVKEKEYILALIEAYYQKPQLWNTLLPKCNNVQREMLFQNITDELNQKLKRNLKLYTIKNKINDICKKYEKEIKRQLEADEKTIETNITELWFYENMSFLKTSIESKLKQKRKKTYHKVKPLSDDLLCEIIDVYKTYSSLWNVNHVAYPIKQKRDESLQSMVEDVKKKIDIPLDVDKLEKHLLHIHNSFSKDKEDKLKCEGKHIGFRPTCSFYNKCDFLEEHQGPFKCPYCSEIHMQYKDFQIHKSQHDGSIPFKCQECGMGFKASGNYTLHVKRHLGVFRYRCNICDKGYPLNSELTLHMRSHTGAQPYLCSICGEGFRAAIGYDNHMRRHEERFRYHCQICKRGFNVLATLRDHVNAHLNVRNFVCNDCGKSFTSKKYLQYHSRIHGSKNYTCNICGKSYAQDAGLRQHKRHMHATRIPARMSSTSVSNCNTVSKKCGEIIITMKKNAKNVYSFNCWFCDTICIQMKKFTLHLEREHVTELEHTTSIATEQYKPENAISDIEKVNSIDNILVREIKVEDCDSENIKSETSEEKSQVIKECNDKEEVIPRFQDPLETFEENHDGILLPISEVLINQKASKLDTNEYFEKIQPTEDVEMHYFSADEQHEYHSDLSGEESSDSDFKIEDNVDDKLMKPFKQSAKSKEKELILGLIDAYYKNPQLWDTTLMERCNLKQKDDILQTITDELNANLKMKLKLYMVKKKLNFICKQYEKEIERQINENDNSKESQNSELWFFENMSFLKSTVENKLKLKRKKPKHKVKPLNDNLLSELIDIYKNYNSLWDVNHIAYTVKDKRHETMESMLEDINTKMNLTLDIYKLEKHLHFIHKSFAKEKHHKLECQINQEDFHPSCSYFNKCDFLESNQGPFKCPNCNEIIETYNDFQVHKSQHDGSVPFKCQECGMGFKKVTNYTIHAKRHLRVFKFHCEICGKGYPFNAELDLHMRSHTGAQPYLCSVCGEGFRTAISYDNHIRRHEERFKYFCHICKKGFNHMTRLNDHVKAHLNVRDVICTVCGKGFTSRKYLNHHKRIHEGKNYSCNICGKSFAQDAGLRAHKKYHGTPIGISSIQKEQNKYNLL